MTLLPPICGVSCCYPRAHNLAGRVACNPAGFVLMR